MSATERLSFVGKPFANDMLLRAGVGESAAPAGARQVAWGAREAVEAARRTVCGAREALVAARPTVCGAREVSVAERAPT